MMRKLIFNTMKIGCITSDVWDASPSSSFFCFKWGCVTGLVLIFLPSWYTNGSDWDFKRILELWHTDGY